MKESIELCREAIDGWKKTMYELVPKQMLISYIIGSMNEEQLKKFKEEEPDGYEHFFTHIKKGIELSEKNICNNCKYQNDFESNFCKKCGDKLNNE